jgi:uncharacterized membrane protein
MEFTNPMNISSIEKALNITPPINFTLEWSKNNTYLKIIFNENLRYNTVYNMIINATGMDVNGTNLDSPFILIFSTEKKTIPDKPDTIFGIDIEKFYSYIGVVIILIIILVFIFVFKNRRKQKAQGSEKEITDLEGRHEPPRSQIAEDFYTDLDLQNGTKEVIEDLKERALTLKKPSDFGHSKDKKLKKVQDKYRKGEISKDTYESILEIMGKQI